MLFQVGEQFLDAGGRYSDIWHRRVGTGPFVRKGPGVSYVKTEEN